MQVIIPFLQEAGIQKFACVGFCFGGYVAFLASQTGLFSCGVGAHSSIKAFNFNGSNEVEAALAVTCPQMLLQAGNDPDNTKPGGEVETALRSLPFGASCVVKEFPEMTHGWMTRGSLSDGAVARDVAAGMQLILSFLNQNL